MSGEHPVGRTQIPGPPCLVALSFKPNSNDGRLPDHVTGSVNHDVLVYSPADPNRTPMVPIYGADLVRRCQVDTRHFGFTDLLAVTGAEKARWSLLRLAPEEHARFRKPIAHIFSASNVGKTRPQAERIASEVVANIKPDKDDIFDFYTASKLFAMQVICNDLGIDPNGHPQDLGIDPNEHLKDPSQAWKKKTNGELILDWSRKAFGVLKNDEDSEAALKAWSEEYEFYKAVVKDKRENPDNKTLSQMLRAYYEAYGDEISDEDIAHYAFAVISNGAPALLVAIRAGMDWLLKLDEGVRQQAISRLRSPDRKEQAKAIDELLRLTFAIVLPREALEDVTLGDKNIPKGTVVLPSVISATFDGSKTDNPHAYDPDRRNGRYLSNTAFGAGSHACLGVEQARVWMAAFFGEHGLFGRYDQPRLASKCEYLEEATLPTPQELKLYSGPEAQGYSRAREAYCIPNSEQAKK
jgi:cytochrome P450